MKKSNPLVSVIIPTKNSSNVIGLSIKSIKSQSYKNIEIIIVDNNSTDDTKDIAGEYTKLVFDKGPERSTQRNFGVKKSKGKYVLFIDSDMTLEKNVVKEGVDILENNLQAGGLIIPEKSIGESFWAKCKALEKKFYHGVEWIEAGRFYRKSVFEKVQGFDPSLISGEDWDLSHRVEKKFKILRTKSFVMHHEGRTSLFAVVRKKYYYSTHISKYMDKNAGSLNIMVMDRYMLFFSKPNILFKDPILGLGLLFMKTSEFGAGAIGYVIGRMKYKKL